MSVMNTDWKSPASVLEFVKTKEYVPVTSVKVAKPPIAVAAVAPAVSVPRIRDPNEGRLPSNVCLELFHSHPDADGTGCTNPLTGNREWRHIYCVKYQTRSDVNELKEPCLLRWARKMAVSDMDDDQLEIRLRSAVRSVILILQNGLVQDVITATHFFEPHKSMLRQVRKFKAALTVPVDSERYEYDNYSPEDLTRCEIQCLLDVIEACILPMVVAFYVRGQIISECEAHIVFEKARLSTYPFDRVSFGQLAVLCVVRDYILSHMFRHLLYTTPRVPTLDQWIKTISIAKRVYDQNGVAFRAISSSFDVEKWTKEYAPEYARFVDRMTLSCDVRVEGCLCNYEDHITKSFAGDKNLFFLANMRAGILSDSTWKYISETQLRLWICLDLIIQHVMYQVLFGTVKYTEMYTLNVKARPVAHKVTAASISTPPATPASSPQGQESKTAPGRTTPLKPRQQQSSPEKPSPAKSFVCIKSTVADHLFDLCIQSKFWMW